jgi:hypothetical protein
MPACIYCGEDASPQDEHEACFQASCLADALTDVEARYRTAAEHAEDLRAERNEAVRVALAAGWTHARIAEATGLTRGRVGQISASFERIA